MGQLHLRLFRWFHTFGLPKTFCREEQSPIAVLRPDRLPAAIGEIHRIPWPCPHGLQHARGQDEAAVTGNSPLYFHLVHVIHLPPRFHPVPFPFSVPHRMRPRPPHPHGCPPLPAVPQGPRSGRIPLSAPSAGRWGCNLHRCGYTPSPGSRRVPSSDFLRGQSKVPPCIRPQSALPASRPSPPKAAVSLRSLLQSGLLPTAVSQSLPSSLSPPGIQSPNRLICCGPASFRSSGS